MDTSKQWRGGWLEAAQHCASPNFGLRPPAVQVDLIVIHSISLPPGQYGGQEIQQLFTNQLDWDAHPYFQTIRGMEVSAHFLIRRDGVLQQFVDCDARAWHAGTSCFQGRENCNDFSIGIELEGIEGGQFELAQYDQLVFVCQTLRRRYPIRFVAGHEHIAAGRKVDPGLGFDWARLIRSVDWPPQCFPLLPSFE